MKEKNSIEQARSDEKPVRPRSRLGRRVVLVLVLTLLVAAGLLMKSILSGAYADRIVYSAKIGRVVDHATGKGIPDVIVLAKGSFNVSRYYGSQNGCLYGLSVHTDADGNFELPSTWSRVPIGIPVFGRPRVTWEFSIVKPGYVMVGDKARIEFDEAGYLKNFVGFEANPLNTSWSGHTVRIAPVEMEPATLSLREQVAYYEKMGTLGCDAASASAYATWSRQMFDYWKPQVCGAPPEETVDTPTTFGLSGIAPNSRKARDRLAELDPAFQHPDPFNRPHQYRLGDLCQAMTAGEAP